MSEVYLELQHYRIVDNVTLFYLFDFGSKPVDRVTIWLITQVRRVHIDYVIDMNPNPENEAMGFFNITDIPFYEISLLRIIVKS